MGLLGGTIKFTGKVIGKTGECGIMALGKMISVGAKIGHKPEIAEKSGKISKGLGKAVLKTAELTGKGLGTAMDEAIKYGAKAGGGLGTYIAKAKGADEKQIKRAKTIGTIIGGGVVGLCLGDLVGAAVTGIAATSGVASTSTAATLHGLVAAKVAVAGGIDGAKK